MSSCKKLKPKVIFLNLMASVLVLMGCGGNEETGQHLAEHSIEKDYVYTAETKDFASTDSVTSICKSENGVYIATQNAVYDVDGETGETVQISLPLEDVEASGVLQIAEDRQGNLIFVEQFVKKNGGENSYYIKMISPKDGSLLTKLDVTSLLGDVQNAGVSGLVVDNENNYYLAIDRAILVLNRDGKEQFSVQPNMKWILDMAVLDDGRVAFLAPNAETSEAALGIGIIDPQKKKMTEAYSGLPGGNSSGNITAGQDGIIWVNCNGGVYSYDMKNHEVMEEFRWNDSGISSDTVRFLMTAADGNFVAVVTQPAQNQFSTKIVTLTQTKKSEVSDKEVLTLGVFVEDPALQEMVLEFNKQNEKYQIEVKAYCKDIYDNEVAEQGLQQMMLDVVSGNGPDLLDVSAMDVNQLAAKGVFEDLYPYLQNDADLQNVEIFQSVLDANTIDGKLVGIPSFCVLDTLLGAQSDFGTESGLTLERLIEISGQKQGTKQIFSTPYEYLLEILFGNIQNQFINWESGECSLDSAEFKQLLELVKTYAPQEQQNNSGSGVPSPALLEYFTISNGLSLHEADFIMGDKAVSIGYPVLEGDSSNGVRIQGSQVLYMSASSEYKEGCWEFLKMFLMPEFYTKHMEMDMPYMPFPVRKKICMI